jgi:peptidoglycan/LPS O-acetylase OafA/YrhL
MSHRYYPALDGLRTIAVGIVLAAHGGVTWFRSGGVGVDVFFVLSGFLITTILSTEWARTGDINFRNFYARRFLRLVPALVITCALVAVMKPAFGEPFPGTDIALALTYTSNWAQAFFGYHLTWLNHCWSLAIEEQFYLIWPLVIIGLERAIHSPAAKVGALLAGAAIIAGWRAWHVGVWTDERINFGLDTRMDTLMVGAALAYFVRIATYTPRHVAPPLFIEGTLNDSVSEIPSMKRGLGAIGHAKAAAQGAGCVGLHDAVSKLLGWFLAPLALATIFLIPNIVTWYSPWMGWIGYVIVAGLSAVILADLVLGRHSLIAPVLAARPMVFVGRISYGIYLLHLPVYYAVEKLIPESPLGVRLGWKVGVSLALATASFYLIEKRFLRMKTKFEG